jgi:hypothetical protein
MERELQISDKQVPTSEQLYTFLKHRCNALEWLQGKLKIHEQKHETTKPIAQKGHYQSYVSVKSSVTCAEIHAFYTIVPNVNSYKMMRNIM